MRAIRSQGETSRGDDDDPHPKTMQMVTDQRWHELQVKTHRERLGMTADEQQPGATSRGDAAAACRQCRAEAAVGPRLASGNR